MTQQRMSRYKYGVKLKSQENWTMSTFFTDPVCWTNIDINSVAGKSEYKGRVYFFCSEGCKQVFDKEPDEFADESLSIPQEQLMDKTAK